MNDPRDHAESVSEARELDRSGNGGSSSSCLTMLALVVAVVTTIAAKLKGDSK